MLQVIWRRNLACLVGNWIARSVTFLCVRRVTGVVEEPATLLFSLSSSHLMLCFMHWPRWGQSDTMPTSLNSCSCHPRYNGQEVKDAHFPFFLLVCYNSWAPAPWHKKLEPKAPFFRDPARGHLLLVLDRAREGSARLMPSGQVVVFTAADMVS